MDHVQVKAKSMARSNSTKIACEKATKRLRSTLCKATRLGVSTSEVAGLPSAKKLIPQRDHGWRLAVFMVLMFCGGVIVALVCMAKNGCNRIEDINRNYVRLFPNVIIPRGWVSGNTRKQLEHIVARQIGAHHLRFDNDTVLGVSLNPPAYLYVTSGGYQFLLAHHHQRVTAGGWISEDESDDESDNDRNNPRNVREVVGAERHIENMDTSDSEDETEDEDDSRSEGVEDVSSESDVDMDSCGSEDETEEDNNSEDEGDGDISSESDVNMESSDSEDELEENNDSGSDMELENNDSEDELEENNDSESGMELENREDELEEGRDIEHAGGDDAVDAVEEEDVAEQQPRIMVGILEDDSEPQMRMENIMAIMADEIDKRATDYIEQRVAPRVEFEEGMTLDEWRQTNLKLYRHHRRQLHIDLLEEAAERTITKSREVMLLAQEHIHANLSLEYLKSIQREEWEE